MRIDGTLAKWNDDRGFGFIAPMEGGPEVFVHISAFPKDGRRPALSERLSFEIEIGKDGKKRATNILCARRPPVRPARPIRSNRRPERRGFFGRAMPLLIVLGLAAYGYSEYSQRVGHSGGSRPLAGSAAEPLGSAATFTCDGRIHCSQMTSCAEAEFFLRNCPGVEMDGDHDGIPCEQQWCPG
jgi:cold shock CspA family protein